MKSVGEISRAYGIPVSTINSAVETRLLEIIEDAGKPRKIDDRSEKFQNWLKLRLQQSRVKGESGFVKDLAAYASEYGIRVPGNVPEDYAVREPLSMLFNILESSDDDLDFAQAASIGEIARLTGCPLAIAEEYVGLFYQQIGGNQANRPDVMKLLEKRQVLRSAYLAMCRKAKRPV